MITRMPLFGRSIFGLIASSLIGGCATPSLLPARVTSPMSIPVVPVDLSGNRLPANDPSASGHFVLSSIAGLMMGVPLGSIDIFTLGIVDEININTANLENALATKSAVLSTSGTQSGIKMSPEETRFARVATLFIPDSRKSSVAGFIDLHTKRYLVLVYFDRRCRMKGNVTPPPEAGGPWKRIRYDIEIAEPGMHWLDIIPEANGVLLTQVKRPPAPLIAIAPMENQVNGVLQIK
jgi:hypothetical protein